jgi:hypothetical protein
MFQVSEWKWWAIQPCRRLPLLFWLRSRCTAAHNNRPQRAGRKYYMNVLRWPLYIDDEWSISKQKTAIALLFQFFVSSFCLYPINLNILIINNRSYPIYYMGCCPWAIGHYFNFTTRQTFVSRIKRRDTCNSDDVMANTGSCCTPTYLIYLVLFILNWSGKDTKKDIKCHWYTPGDVDCAAP